MKTLKSGDCSGFFQREPERARRRRRYRAGFRQIYPQAHYVKLPMADGGEGTVESMVAATGGEIVQMTVTGPLGSRYRGSMACWATEKPR